MASHVLVVEDDPDIREAISEALAMEGYDVAGAGDGLEALEAARQRAPDLILLDLMMPRMDGWSFRAAQAKDPQLAGVPVVVVSAAMRHQMHSVDAVGYLQKPFNLSDLYAIVARFASAGERALRALV